MMDGVVGIVWVIEGQLETFEEIMLKVEELLIDVVGVFVEFIERIQ